MKSTIIRLSVSEERREQYAAQARREEKTMREWLIDVADVACITGRQIEREMTKDENTRA